MARKKTHYKRSKKQDNKWKDDVKVLSTLFGGIILVLMATIFVVICPFAFILPAFASGDATLGGSLLIAWVCTFGILMYLVVSF